MKSRKTAEKRNKQPPADPLILQKQTIRAATFGHLRVTVMFLVIAVVVTIMMLHDVHDNPTAIWMPGFFLVEFIVFGIFLYWCGDFVRRFAISRKLERIKVSSEQSVSVHCRKVSFLLRHVSRFSPPVILCVVLKDETRNKFCYVCLEKWEASSLAKRHIKERYSGRTVNLVCYRDTNMVKALPLQIDAPTDC